MHSKIKNFIFSILFKIFPSLEKRFYISDGKVEDLAALDLSDDEDDLDLEDGDLDEDEEFDDYEDEETNLDEAAKLISEHIPVVISDFYRASEEVPDLHKKIVGTFITHVTFNEKYIYAKLHSVSGNFAGYLRFHPTKGGIFSSYQSDAVDDEEDEDADDIELMYKIVFYGGSVLEYYDDKESPAIDYFLNLPKRIK